MNLLVFAREPRSKQYELLATFWEHLNNADQVAKSFRQYLDSSEDAREVVVLEVSNKVTLEHGRRHKC